MIRLTARTIVEVQYVEETLHRHGGRLTDKRMVVSRSGVVRFVGTIRDHNYPGSENEYEIEVLARHPELYAQVVN